MSATKPIERLSSTKKYQHSLDVNIDARCWRAIYYLQRLWEERNGWFPSRDWVISELLVDAKRGAEMLSEAHKSFRGMAVPWQNSPAGNRYKRAVSPNYEYPAGVNRRRDDWGTPAGRMG